MWNPNFWKYLLGPLVLYGIERTVRVVRSRTTVGVISVFNMFTKVWVPNRETGELKSEIKSIFALEMAPFFTRKYVVSSKKGFF